VGNLLELVDTLLIGGGMANTFLLAEGIEIGASLAERDLVDDARAILERAQANGVEIVLPTDAIVAPSIDAEGRPVPISEVPADEAIFDIGPETVAAFSKVIDGAAT